MKCFKEAEADVKIEINSRIEDAKKKILELQKLQARLQDIKEVYLECINIAKDVMGEYGGPDMETSYEEIVPLDLNLTFTFSKDCHLRLGFIYVAGVDEDWFACHLYIYRNTAYPTDNNLYKDSWYYESEAGTDFRSFLSKALDYLDQVRSR